VDRERLPDLGPAAAKRGAALLHLGGIELHAQKLRVGAE
jgi:hypothetical protein